MYIYAAQVLHIFHLGQIKKFNCFVISYFFSKKLRSVHPTVESSSARSVHHTKSSSGVCTPPWSQVLHAVCIIPSQAPQYASHRGVKFCTQCASYRVKLRGMHHTVESNCTPRIQSFLNFMIKYLSKIKTEFENF